MIYPAKLLGKSLKMQTINQAIHAVIFWISIGVSMLSLTWMLLLLAQQTIDKTPEKTGRTIQTEMLWALVPLVMIIGLALPAILQFLTQH